MSPAPDPQRRRPLHSGDPVERQPEPGDVPVDWLDEPAHAARAEAVDRLAADYDLVTDLAWRQFIGADYDVFQTELARYGIAVLTAWMRSRVIFQRVRDRGYGGLPEPPSGSMDDPDVVDELANETVAKALRHFRDDVLVPGKWDYRRGATLRTYFIGQCLIRFANIYRRWWAEEARHHRAILTDPQDLALDGKASLGGKVIDSPERHVARQDEVERALARVQDPRVRRALVLVGTGLTHAEIASDLNVTTKAVERMIANERDRMKRRGIA